MAEHTGERSRMTRTRKRSSAAVLLCWGALALLGISSAAAHPGHGKGGPSAPASATPSPSGPALDDGASQAAPASSSPPAEAPSGPPAAVAAPKGHAHSAPGADKGKGGGKARTATLAPPTVEVPALPHVSVPSLPTPQPASTPAPPPAQPSTTPAQTAPPAATTQPAAGPPASSAPVATQPASRDIRSTPKRGAGKGARRAVSRRARRHRRGTGSGAATSRLPQAGSVAQKGTGAANRGARSPRGKRVAHHPQAVGQLEPIVKTITKIVGVVPLAVRLLIGVLLALALALLVRSGLAGLRTRRLERHRAQLLQDVGLLQGALLPVSPARIGPVGTSVAYRPADGPAAGGDFYDVFALEGGLIGVIVGDVSGHGRQALPHTALLRFTMRAYLEAGLSPREVLRTAGTVLERQLGASFATVVVATYHPRERVLTYASAGHPPPIVAGSGAAITTITVSASPPIGTGMQTGARQTVISLPGEARVCFHTDGITEARIGSDLFGAERLTRAVEGLEPGSGASALLDRVAQQTDARPDDMAACLLAIDGPEQPPRVLLEQLQVSSEDARERSERFLEACGVDAAQAEQKTSAAYAMATQTGAALLEVRFAGGSPQVSVRADNVASLRSAQAAQPAALEVAQ
jgi:hypothetical protein